MIRSCASFTVLFSHCVNHSLAGRLPIVRGSITTAPRCYCPGLGIMNFNSARSRHLHASCFKRVVRGTRHCKGHTRRRGFATLLQYFRPSCTITRGHPEAGTGLRGLCPRTSLGVSTSVRPNHVRRCIDPAFCTPGID